MRAGRRPDAAARGVRAAVGFTYRRVPAVALARQLVAEGRIGEIRHVRAQYLQDWIADPAAPMSWRLEKDRAGSGALGVRGDGRQARPRRWGHALVSSGHGLTAPVVIRRHNQLAGACPPCPADAARGCVSV